MPESKQLTIRLTQEVFPPHHESHGTASTVVRRTLVFELAEGTAEWEQSDYGHPGRFNPWDPRGIAPRLQPRTAALKQAAEAIGALIE